MGGMVPLGDTMGTCAGPEHTQNAAESIKDHGQNLKHAWVCMAWCVCTVCVCLPVMH